MKIDNRVAVGGQRQPKTDSGSEIRTINETIVAAAESQMFGLK